MATSTGLRDKRDLLKAMKFNQRSTFNFKAKGLYGPKAVLWESLDQKRQEECKKEGFSLEDPHGEHHLYWTDPPQNILVIKKFKDKDVTLKFMDLTRWLVEEKKLDVVVEPSVLNESTVLDDPSYKSVMDCLLSWEDGNQVSRKECLESVDLIVCVGGDGTLLYTSSLFQAHLPPILSFHLGSLGFLAPFQFESDDLSADVEDRTLYKKCIEKALKGGASLTLRHRLECVVKMDDVVDTAGQEELCPISPTEFDSKLKFGIEKKLRLPDSRTKALPKMLVMNDLVVDRGPNPYLTNLIIYCNGRKMTSVQGDGIIIATPTGSTAYSLAAGASMVHPSVPAIVVTPICPHSLSFRSIVVPAGVELMIKVAPSSRNSAWVSFDGRNRQEITHGNSLTVSTSPYPVPSINNTGHVTDWFDSLAECLHWNIRKEQKAFKRT